MNTHFFEQHQKQIISLILAGLATLLISSLWQGAMEINWHNVFDTSYNDPVQKQLKILAYNPLFLP